MTGPGGDAPFALEGTWARLERVDPSDLSQAGELAHLDWLRSQSAEMGGWFLRPAPGGALTSSLFRSLATGEVVGVLDAAPLLGYPGVVSLSIFTDTSAATSGCAMDAYSMCVSLLFEGGARLIHHEVLEHNRPVLRILRAVGLEPTARLRGARVYAAGRLWDVMAFSFDQDRWEAVSARFGRRWPRAFPFRGAQERAAAGPDQAADRGGQGAAGHAASA